MKDALSEEEVAEIERKYNKLNAEEQLQVATTAMKDALAAEVAEIERKRKKMEGETGKGDKKKEDDEED